MTFAQLVGTSAPLQVVLTDDWFFGRWAVAAVTRERTGRADGATAFRLKPTVDDVSAAC